MARALASRGTVKRTNGGRVDLAEWDKYFGVNLEQENALLVGGDGGRMGGLTGAESLRAITV